MHCIKAATLGGFYFVKDVDYLVAQDYIKHMDAAHGARRETERKFVRTKNLTHERLKELFSYDRQTGIFQKRYQGRHRGAFLGAITEKGYLVITVDGWPYKAHRLAWMYEYGDFPPGALDHINQIKTDNRISNLRLATLSQNAANTRLLRNSKTGAKGVCVRDGRYWASIMVNKKNKALGMFNTVDEAAHAYNKAAIELFGEFAVLNPIGTDY